MTSHPLHNMNKKNQFLKLRKSMKIVLVKLENLMQVIYRDLIWVSPSKKFLDK